MGLGRLLPQSRAVNAMPWVKAFETGSDVFGASRTWSGQDVSDESSMQLMAVYGAVNFIVSHGETFPRDTYRQIGSRPPENVKNPAVVDNFPLGTLLYSYLLDGNAFAIPARNELGQVFNVVPLDPSTVQLELVGGRTAVRINGVPYSGEFWHLPHMVPPGKVRGVNPIEACRQTIGMGLASSQFGAKFFGQGTVMSGVLQFPGPMPDRDELKTIRDNWTRVHGGSANSHLPGVLFGGAEWKPISIPPEQAQFLETRRFTAAEIVGQMFLLPPSALSISDGSKSMTYQNVETEWTNILRRLQPLLTKFERAISALLPPRYSMKFNLDAYLRPDTKTRAEVFQIAGGGKPWRTQNELRALDDLPPVEGGDTLEAPSAAPVTAP